MLGTYCTPCFTLISSTSCPTINTCKDSDGLDGHVGYIYITFDIHTVRMVSTVDDQVCFFA